MFEKYNAPPYQPKWILQTQVFLLRHLHTAFNHQTMIITTTGRKTGHRHSVPIGYVPDGNTFLAVNLGGHSNWYLNALANPCVTLEIEGQTIEARVESVPIGTPRQLQQVLHVIARERPKMFENLFGTATSDMPEDKLARIEKRVSFLRFCPLP